VRTRELRATELANLGWSQHQIAEDLGISQAAVSKIIQRVELRVLRELADTVERQKAQQSLRIAHLYAEAMKAWEQSKSDTTRRRQRKTDGGRGGTGATVAEMVVQTHHGDPRYLEQARKALADHRKVWGLDAPQQLDLRTPRNPYDDLSEEALREEWARQNLLLPDGLSVAVNPVQADSITAAPVAAEPVRSTDEGPHGE
jgi:predicted transcriptional regulator